MLDLLRSKAQSPYLQATVVIIALVFIFWGAQSNIGPEKSSNNVATVNGQKISFEEYGRAYNQVMNRYQEQFGGAIPEKLLEGLDLKNQVLNQLVERTLIQEGAQKVGISVSKEELRDKIQQMEAFKKNNAFDLGLYKEILGASRLSVSEFEASLRADILTGKIVDHLSRFGRVVPAEVEERFNREYSQNRFEYLVFDPAQFKDRAKVAPEDIAPFFEKNKDQYKTDPQVNIRYLAFPFSDDLASAPVTPEDISNYYNQNPDKFKLPEQRLLSHILIKAAQTASPEQLASRKKQATDILAKVKSGKDFAALAKQYSEDSSAAQGGELGLIARGQTVKSFEDAAFSLPEGGISNVVQSQFGLHIIKVLKIMLPRTRSLAEASPEISQSLRLEKGRPLTFKRANAAYEQIILAGSLEKGAASANVKETGFISQNSQTGDKADPQFVAAALKLKKGELSSLVEGRDGYYILSAKETRDPMVPALADVRERVKNDVLADRAKVLAKEAAARALTELKTGANFLETAKKYGLTPQETEYVTRGRMQGLDIPAQVVQTGFNLTEKAPYIKEVEEVEGLYYVTRLKDKKAPPPELVAAKQKDYQKRLQDENGGLLMTAWVEHLRSKADITTNKQFIQ